MAKKKTTCINESTKKLLITTSFDEHTNILFCITLLKLETKSKHASQYNNIRAFQYVRVHDTIQQSPKALSKQLQVFSKVLTNGRFKPF